MPVVAPASSPPAEPATVASGAETPSTSSAAAIAAPSVSEPSVVMSGKRKTRKLTKTPSARSARIRPMVRDPSSSVMRRSRAGDRGDGTHPADSAHELALSGPDPLARIAEQVQDALEDRALEERDDALAQLEAAACQRAVRERGRVEVARRFVRCERSEPGRQGGLGLARRDPDHERLAVAEGGL